MQMSQEKVAEVSYCYNSRDSRKIVRKFPFMEAAKFTDRDRTFLDVTPGKGLTLVLTPLPTTLSDESVY